MGIVYKARQIKLNRIVALKMILAGAHARPADLARFRSEAEAVARLQHPNIVHIYEIGDQDGCPYFSLEYVDGGSLRQHLNGAPLAARPAARFLETVARTVDAAHKQGIVHRDLKPGNILLKNETAVSREETERRGEMAGDGAATESSFAERPSSFIPKITDFGLAKRLTAESLPEGDCVTQVGSVLGTPSYMAPEQAAGEGDQAGPAADIYALGTSLYELLTGRPPFRAATPVDTILQVISLEPVPPSRLQPWVPRDLDTICLKCLEKNPRRRFATALELADELHRFINHKPIHARPTPFWERGMKWARRRPAAATLSVVAMVAAALGFSDVVRRWQHEAAGQVSALAQRDLYAKEFYFAQISLADKAWNDNQPDQARLALDACPQPLRHWEWHYLNGLCAAGFFNIPEGGGINIAFHPSGHVFAVANLLTRSVAVWDAHTGQRLLAVSDAGPALAFSPDGSRIAVSTWPDSADARQASLVKVLEAQHGREEYTLAGHSGPVWGLSFSPDGKQLASASADATIKLWDCLTHAEVRTLRGHSSAVRSVAFSPGGSTLASSGADDKVRIWQLDTGKCLHTLRADDHLADEIPSPQTEAPDQTREPRAVNKATGSLRPLAFSPDGRYLIFGAGNLARVFDVKEHRKLHSLRGHGDRVRSVIYSPDGQRIATAGADRAVKVWDAATERELFTLRGHAGPVNGVAFSPDGSRLVSVGPERIRIWNATGPPGRLEIRLGLARRGPVAISPDGNRLAGIAETGIPTVWNFTGQTCADLLEDIGQTTCLAFSPDGTTLASGGTDRMVRIWDAGAGRLKRALAGHSSAIAALCISGDGAQIASADDEGTVKVWDLAAGNEIRCVERTEHGIAVLAFRPDGLGLALGGKAGFLELWDFDAASRLRVLAGHADAVADVGFSPNGRHLASASQDGTVKLWDAGTRQELQVLRGSEEGVAAIAFTPDGSRIASAYDDGAIHIWEPLASRDILTLRGHAGAVRALLFSTDGQRLWSVGQDGTWRTWNADTLQENTDTSPGNPPAQGLTETADLKAPSP
jgi:WD40 repeat protein